MTQNNNLKTLLSAAELNSSSVDAFIKEVVQNKELKSINASFTAIQDALKEPKMEVRKNGCTLLRLMSEKKMKVLDPFFMSILPLVLVMCGDKKREVQTEASKTAFAISASVNLLSIRTLLLPVLYQALTLENKWQTKVASLSIIVNLVELAPKVVASSLPDLIPEITNVIWDTKVEVQQQAKKALASVCIGNDDITPFVPALIECMLYPEQVSECVYKLASTTFVKAVDAPTLAIMLPLLSRGLQSNNNAVMRQTSVIIDNMCKLVENPTEAQLFLPLLLPLLAKVIDTASDPECRKIATRGHATLARAGGLKDDAIIDENTVLMNKVTLTQVTEAMQKVITSTKALATLTPDTPSFSYVCGLIQELLLCEVTNQTKWIQEGLLPYLRLVCGNDATAEASCAIIYKYWMDVATAREKQLKGKAEEDDGMPILCDCEFSLAYGGMILLSNTRLLLKKGHIYGLCGANGCGKSTLMRAMAKGQLDGFPPKSELKTKLVEINMSATDAEMNVVEYILADPDVTDVSAEAVKEKLSSLHFTPSMIAGLVGSLSGGWKMKLELSKAILAKADILLLDEPTNHLDISNVAWVQNYIKGLKEVTTLVVSHDSSFLDTVCTDIIHYETTRKLKTYKGNLAAFVAVRPEAKAYYTLETADQEAFQFPEPGFLDNVKNKGKRLLKLDNCTYTYPGCSTPSVTNITLSCALASRVAVLGPNGAGKSTVIKLLTGETEPDSGTLTKHPNLRFAYVAQHAFHHLEDHLDKTANQYVQWRFQNGTDKELMEKATRQLSPEEKEQMNKVIPFEGNKRQIEALRSRRKAKRSFEYEIEWRGNSLSVEEKFVWVPREQLEKWGFQKLLQLTDDQEAARANLMAKPVTSGVIEKFFQDFGLGPEFSTHSRLRGLSGGQKVKVVLGAAMWQNPHMIVLDEPTNFLDRDSLGALSTAIKNFNGGVVLISHHTEFTEQLCTEIWDVQNGKLQIRGESAVDNDTTKIEQALEQVAIDAFGNEKKVKMKRELNRKEKIARAKLKKEVEARGDYWDSDDY